MNAPLSTRQPAATDNASDHSAFTAGQEHRAYMRFLGAARSYWAGPMFTALRDQVQALPEVKRDRQEEQESVAGRAPVTDFRAQVEALPTYQVFGWLERHLQRMRYSGPRGLVAAVEARRDPLVAELAQPLPEGLLELNADLRLPDYFTSCDIHQQPGGVAADVLSAHVYREATQGGVVGVASLHERFASEVLQKWPHAWLPARILDMGCGFGRGAHAFAAALPDAHVCGVDLSASCVMLAAHDTPEPLRPRLRFVQADTTDTGLAAESFDLLSSIMLLHEMSEAAVRTLIHESGRLLAPGGMVAHLDFLPPADPFLRLLYEGHAARNNEPYLLEHSRIDLVSAYQSAGFETVEVVDFAETDDALEVPAKRWRLPWKIIFAIKAEKS